MGFVLGRWLGLTRWEHATLAAISIASAVVQAGFPFVTSDRSWMTMLPLLIGTTVVAGMLFGALLRPASRTRSSA